MALEKEDAHRSCCMDGMGSLVIQSQAITGCEAAALEPFHVALLCLFVCLDVCCPKLECFAGVDVDVRMCLRLENVTFRLFRADLSWIIEDLWWSGLGLRSATTSLYTWNNTVLAVSEAPIQHTLEA